MISFYGNEFFIGWILFSWMFWTGIGSFYLVKLFKNKHSLKLLLGCHIFIALFLFLEIYLIRLSRTLIGAYPGEIPNLVPALFYAFLIIAPLCLVYGLQFVIASLAWKTYQNRISSSFILGKSYFYETLGFVVGGLVFSYFLTFVNEFKIVSILAYLNLISAWLVINLAKKRFTRFKIILIILLVAFISIFLYSNHLNIWTRGLNFPKQTLVESKNTLYGNISITKTNNQYNFYESGLLIGPNKEKVFNEYLIHFPLLYHPKPKKVLLIGGGFNGALSEILKHQPAKIYYLEIDPKFIKTIKNYLTPEVYEDLENNKIKIFYIDGRHFLKINQEKFDIIIINLPNPSTALLNRFYTKEFFNIAKNHLDSQGILAFHLSSSPNYLSPELKTFQSSLYKTIKEVFPNLIILPEDNIFFLASQTTLDYNPQILIQRLKNRNIRTDFVTENYIKYRLTNDRIPKVINGLKLNEEIKVNLDQLPISYYYNLIYWVSYFHKNLANFLNSVSKIEFKWFIMLTSLIFLAVLTLFLNKKFRNKKFQDIFPLIMAISGFTLMATEIIIIYSFQIFYGYLYYRIALIISILMAGMSIGSWVASNKLEKFKIKSLAMIHFLIILFSLSFLLGSWLLFEYSPRPSLIIELIFLTLTGSIGAIVGFEFPILNKFYLKNKPLKKTGVVYGADLLGSCLAAFLVSVFLLPIFGIFQVVFILILLNLFVLISLFLSRKFSL